MLRTAARLTTVLVAISVASTAHAASTHRRGTEWRQSGQASWYGPRFHGHRTTSGQIFNQNAMTAAHSTLPLGTRVRVTRKVTGQSVVVTINDRLPPKRARVIDLSRGAASRLGIVDQGLASVTIVPATRADAEEVAEAFEGRR